MTGSASRGAQHIMPVVRVIGLPESDAWVVMLEVAAITVSGLGVMGELLEHRPLSEVLLFFSERVSRSL